MRRTGIDLVVIGLLLAVPSYAQAQHRGLMDSACGCQACGPHSGDPTCCPPILPCVTQGIQQVLGGLFCCPGLNARHDIYRAALNRNDFGKCSKYVPVYACPTCCCGTRAPVCPHCGPGVDVGGPSAMEMPEVPEGPFGEPTPAVEPDTPPLPADAMPPQATRIRVPGRPAAQPGTKSAPSTKSTRANSTPRDRVARAVVGDESPRPVAQAAARHPAKGTSLIERAMLLQAGGSEPVAARP